MSVTKQPFFGQTDAEDKGNSVFQSPESEFGDHVDLGDLSSLMDGDSDSLDGPGPVQSKTSRRNRIMMWSIIGVGLFIIIALLIGAMRLFSAAGGDDGQGISVPEQDQLFNNSTTANAKPIPPAEGLSREDRNPPKGEVPGSMFFFASGDKTPGQSTPAATIASYDAEFYKEPRTPDQVDKVHSYLVPDTTRSKEEISKNIDLTPNGTKFKLYMFPSSTPVKKNDLDRGASEGSRVIATLMLSMPNDKTYTYAQEFLMMKIGDKWFINSYDEISKS